MTLSIFSRYTLSLLSIGLLLLSQTACTATQLPPYEATYTTKLRGIKIKGLRKFEEIEPDTYKLSWHAKALWMRLNEWSTFKVIDEQVIPLSYHYTRKGLGTDRPIHVTFDWEAMKVYASKGKKDYSFDLEPNTLDKLSFQVQMQLDLLQDQQLKAAHYRIANYNGMRNYQFNYSKNDTIDTELGQQNTLVFERQKRNGGTKLWISPDQNYLPIQIENIDDGKRNVMRIRSWDSKSLSKENQALSYTEPSPHQDNAFSDDDFE